MTRSITRTLNGNVLNSFVDFGWYVTAIRLTPPKKRKILVEVPYRSGSYDFSDLYGPQAYEDRNMQITFSRELPVERDGGQLQRFVNWLYSGGRVDTRDSTAADWYYMAECTSVELGDGLDMVRQVTAAFTADPFRYFVRMASQVTEADAAGGLVAQNHDIVTEQELMGTDTGLTFWLNNPSPCGVVGELWAENDLDLWIQPAPVMLLSLSASYPVSYHYTANGTGINWTSLIIPPGVSGVAIQGQGAFRLDWRPLSV